MGCRKGQTLQNSSGFAPDPTCLISVLPAALCDFHYVKITNALSGLCPFKV